MIHHSKVWTPVHIIYICRIMNNYIFSQFPQEKKHQFLECSKFQDLEEKIKQRKMQKSEVQFIQVNSFLIL